jgi:hypothetical protein
MNIEGQLRDFQDPARQKLALRAKVHKKEEHLLILCALRVRKSRHPHRFTELCRKRDQKFKRNGHELIKFSLTK